MILEPRPNWRNRIALAILVLISIAVLVTHYRENENGVLHRVQGGAMAVLSPIESGAFSIVRWTTDVWTSVTQFTSLKSENDKLKQDMAALRRQTVLGKELQLENERLRKQLNAPVRKEFKTKLATVIGKSVNTWQATIVIDKGEEAGIKKNMAVATGDGLVGQVISVSTSSSIVQLITDQKCAVGGRVQSNRATAIVEGQGGKELNLTFLPKEYKLVKGDLVLTSGIGGVYPPGIVIGTVSSVVAHPQGFYHEALISPAVDFWTLEEVFVVTGEK